MGSSWNRRTSQNKCRWSGFLLILLMGVVSSQRRAPADKILSGAGASLPRLLYQPLLATYEYQRSYFVSMDTAYDHYDSRTGQTTMMQLDNETDYVYGASEAVLTEAEFLAYPDLQMVPVVGGAVVMTYNIPDLHSMNLTREAVVGIYNGTISKWDDPIIQDLNPQFTFPADEDIRVIARSDYSGTTEILTTAFSSFSAEWNDTYGSFPDVKWNASVITSYGRQSTGMMGMIFSYPYSIGYLSVADALAVNFSYARLYNRAGNLVDVTPEGIRVAMNSSVANLGNQMTATFVDYASPDAYPIVGYSYFIIRMHGMMNCDMAVELARYIEWLTSNNYADAEAREMKMSQVLPEVADIIHRNVLEVMTCGSQRSNVWDLVEQQKTRELHAIQGWRIPVFITVPIVIALIIALIIYLIYQQVKLRRIRLSDEWYILYENIQVKWDRTQGWMDASKSRFGSTTTGMTTQTDMSGMGLIAAGPNDSLGSWKDNKVGLRCFPTREFRVTKNSTKMAINILRTQIVHTNVQRFFGVTLSDDVLYLVSEHAEKGCLTDILQNPSYDLDANFKFVMALDVASGMEYLHNHDLVHGNLNSNCCLLDSRWNVKVANWELNRLYAEQQARKASRSTKVSPRPGEDGDANDPNITARANIWRAPEILRALIPEPNRKTDVYSFGILLTEIFTREDPYYEVVETGKMPVDVVFDILNHGLRPSVSELEHKGIVPIMASCWDEQPDTRPTFSYLTKKINKTRPSKKSVIEIMMLTLESYVTNLEEMVHERTAELETVNQSLESLLHQILPATVANKLSRGESVDPETFDSVTIFFSDIVSFTDFCAESSPMEVVNFLNDLYTCFDSIIDELDVYKVETIGDAYMCISGLPIRNGIQHAGNIATMALKLMEASRGFKAKHKPDYKLQLRAGIHSGPVVAGVVGVKMPRYCLFGDTVNTASRMESNSMPMKVQASLDTKILLDKITGYEVVERGTVDIKGKGKLKTYFVEGQKEPNPAVKPAVPPSMTNPRLKEVEFLNKVNGSWQSLKEIFSSTTALRKS